MNADFLLNAFAGIDDDIVLDAGIYASGMEKRPSPRRRVIIRWAAVAAACVLLIIIVPAALGWGPSLFFDLGEAIKGTLESGENEIIVASYKDNQVTQANIDYQQTVYELSVKANEAQGLSPEEIIQMGIVKKTDLEITNDILCGFILSEEAEKLGFAATDAEIEEWVAQQKQTYKEYPEVTDNLDALCKGLGITIDEYWENIQTEAYGTLSRQKLETHMKEEYFATHEAPTGEYSQEDVLAYNEAYRKYMADYRSGLLAAHSDDIVYYEIDAG